MAARFPMAVVVTGSPLTVTIEGASAVVAAEDFVGGLTTDDRVQAAFLGDRLVVLARAGGDTPGATAVHNVQVDAAARSSGTTWTLGPTFTTITGLKVGSRLSVEYYVPARNSSTSWGGGYFELQVRFDGGTWKSLGSSGYSTVMASTSAAIGFYHNRFLIDPALEGISADFTAQFRLYFSSFDGTLNVNTLNQVGSTGAGAPALTGVNNTQNWTHIIVDEIVAGA